MKAEIPPTLFMLVKVLDGHGLKKTLKKLRKETGLKELRIENVPNPILEADFTKYVKYLIKKKPRASQKEAKSAEVEEKETKEVEPASKPGNQSEAEVTKEEVIEGFVKGAELINGKERKRKRETSASSFRRVDDDVWMNKIEKEELLSNGFEMKKDEFGEKAAKELIQVKGKEFRTQKAKKKKASWKGSGEITSEVNSVFFDDSD